MVARTPEDRRRALIEASACLSLGVSGRFNKPLLHKAARIGTRVQGTRILTRRGVVFQAMPFFVGQPLNVSFRAARLYPDPKKALPHRVVVTRPEGASIERTYAVVGRR